MKVESKKTIELSETEIFGFCESFGNTFVGHNKSPEYFRNEYSNTVLGYSFHVLLKNEKGTIVGGYSAIPILYEISGKKKLFACAADLMIEEQYRNDVGNLLSIIQQMNRFLAENEVVYFYGFPNDVSYKINVSLIRMRDIASLYTYILPMRVGDVKPFLKPLNPISRLFCKTLLWLSRFDNDRTVIEHKICKVRPEFDATRYKWFDPGQYVRYENGNVKAVWKISGFENVKACFLLDVFPYSKSNFNDVVREMVKREEKRTGLFIYVGYLPAAPCSMLKLPHKIQPKNFHFVGKVIDKKNFIDADFVNVFDWDVNLSSYDLL